MAFTALHRQSPKRSEVLRDGRGAGQTGTTQAPLALEITMATSRRVASKGNSKDKAQRLIQAGLALFSSRGFHGTSIRDIAEKAGALISDIYYHFDSKDGLLLAILDEKISYVTVDLQEISKRDIDPINRFELMVRNMVMSIKLLEKEAKIMNFDKEYISPECNERIKRGQLETMNLFEKELLNLQTLGYIRYKHTRLLAANILSLIAWLVRWYRPDGPLSLAEIGDEIMTFIFHGVFGRPSPDTEPTSKSS
jgi:TetR/AcrR family transcriptional regulator, cholesterol catabolism regulator